MEIALLYAMKNQYVKYQIFLIESKYMLLFIYAFVFVRAEPGSNKKALLSVVFSVSQKSQRQVAVASVKYKVKV
jgi:hypothetical protein